MCWTVWETQVSHLSFHFTGILKCYLLPRLLAQCVGILENINCLNYTPLYTVGINVSSLVTSFGKHIKFYVKKQLGSSNPPPPAVNAFSIMMSSQRQMCRMLPPLISQPRNKKDELHNAVIQFLEKDSLTWTSSEVDCDLASTTVKTLTDVLWYVDGHQNKFSERSCNLPSLFGEFAGYNKPEMAKHRKRSSMTLSGMLNLLQCAPFRKLPMCVVVAKCACNCIVKTTRMYTIH